jgi:hypothetical protein
LAGRVLLKIVYLLIRRLLGLAVLVFRKDLATLPGDGIRRAVVASVLGLIPDLGGSRILDALRMLFEERNAPTLLVADSLDEVRGG